jgi:hypothetical protein
MIEEVLQMGENPAPERDPVGEILEGCDNHLVPVEIARVEVDGPPLRRAEAVF